MYKAKRTYLREQLGNWISVCNNIANFLVCHIKFTRFACYKQWLDNIFRDSLIQEGQLDERNSLTSQEKTEKKQFLVQMTNSFHSKIYHGVRLQLNNLITPCAEPYQNQILLPIHFIKVQENNIIKQAGFSYNNMLQEVPKFVIWHVSWHLQESVWWYTPETLIRSLEEIEDPNKRAALCNHKK